MRRVTRSPPPDRPSPFAATRWSLVATASGSDETARTALGDLCRGYAYPLYAFARRLGRSTEDAEDLVQSFFAEVMETGMLERADPERGRFRTFLLTAFRNHASKAREREAAWKRGGRARHVSLDAEDGEARYRLEPAHLATAEHLFERRYALVLLDRARERVATRYRSGSAEKAERFEALKPVLEGDRTPSYRVLGERLGLSETAVKVAVHRLRGQLREALRAEVADTVDDPTRIDDEIRHLRDVLARREGVSPG